MKEDIKVIINRMTILDKVKKLVAELLDYHPMDIANEYEVNDALQNEQFVKRINDAFYVEISQEDLSKSMTVIDLCVLIEKKQKKDK